VAENVFLGRRVPAFLGKVRWPELNRAARDLLQELGQDLDVTLDAERLSPVGKTMTSLARALSQRASVLVLDEPTAALTDSETRQLFAAMRKLQARGVAILYVSHRLEEVMGVADRYTVLRNGRRVAWGLLSETSLARLITAMAGRSVATVFPARHSQPSDIVLQVDGLSGRRLTNFGAEIRAGEIVGIAGLAGSGRSEALRLIGGARRPVSGRMRLGDREYTPASPKDAQRAGVALVPQERRSEALIPDSAERNLNVTTIGAHATAGGWISRTRERRHARALWDEFDIRGRGPDQAVMELSGGNQQKVVIAKYAALKPRLLLLDEPTRGVDVSTKGQIYALIRQQAEAGCAVLMTSSELPELLGLCDRIIVLHEGRVVAVVNDPSISEEELLHACYGQVA
jgi:ribose transport system ATP-binding protein